MGWNHQLDLIRFFLLGCLPRRSWRLFIRSRTSRWVKISQFFGKLEVANKCRETAKTPGEFRKKDQLSRWFLMILLAFPGLVRYIIIVILRVSFMISSLRTSSLKFTNGLAVDMIRQRCSTLYRRTIMNGLSFQRGKWIVSWIVREPKLHVGQQVVFWSQGFRKIHENSPEN